MRVSKRLSFRGVTALGLLVVLGYAGCDARDHSGFREGTNEQSTALVAQIRIDITTPSGTDFRTAALGANGSLAIADRAQITSSPNAFGMVMNAGVNQSDFGVESKLGMITSTAPVFLRDRSHIFGAVTSGGGVTKSNGVVVDGNVTANTSAGPPDVASWQISFPQSTQNVTLNRSQSLELLAGSYSQVTVYGGAALKLRTGTYFIDQLDLESQASITLDESAGPIVLYVKSSLIYRGNVTGGTADRLLLVYLGGQAVALETSFHGTFVAPGASVRLGVGGTPHSGAVFARDVQVDPDVKFIALPFASWDSVLIGVSPTLNCVVALDNTTLAALFGYRNTTSSSVKLGAGARNFFSSATDVGQPILFVPGDVHIASIQTFPADGQLSWTIGQQSVVASSSSNRCPAELGNAVSVLFVETPDSKAVRQSVVDVLSNPRFATWVHTARAAAGPQLTPFHASLFDSLDLVLANVDLLGDPAALTTAQRARLPAFRSQFLSNQAIIALRLAGDAMRSGSSQRACAALAELNRDHPTNPLLPVQAGSVYADTLALANSDAFRRVRSSFKSVVTGDQSAALFGTSGIVLAGLLPPDELADLQLAGPVPSSLLGGIVGAVAGAVAGAVVGLATGGPAGAVAGATIGGVAGFVVGTQFDPTCRACNVNSDCGEGDDVPCTARCCEHISVIGSGSEQQAFSTGGGCANSEPSCERDSDCSGGGECVQACCVSLSLMEALCPGLTCTTEADCPSGNFCQGGCCANRCGIGAALCNVVSSDACGIPVAACAGRATCSSDGCCVAPKPQ